MAEDRVFRVEQLGIKDIDGYGHVPEHPAELSAGGQVWYGNYLKFFERAFQSFLGGGTVRQVKALKYKVSVAWGAANSRIETYLVERPGPGLALVYQRWCVGDENTASAFCLTLVGLEPGCGDSAVATPPGERLLHNGPNLAMAVQALRSGAVQPREDSVPLLGQLRVMRRIFPDMVCRGRSGGGGSGAAPGGVLARVDVMDLFEQSRTDVVGGQPGLKAFLDRGLAMVVGQIDELVLAEDVPIAPGGEVVCEVSVLREYAGRRCFDFEQRLLRAVDERELARMRILLCCVDLKEGALAVAPDELWEAWLANVN